MSSYEEILANQCEILHEVLETSIDTEYNSTRNIFVDSYIPQLQLYYESADNDEDDHHSNGVGDKHYMECDSDGNEDAHLIIDNLQVGMQEKIQINRRYRSRFSPRSS